MRPALLPSVLAAVLVTMAAIATPAGAQPPSQRRGPVNVTVSGLFGDDVTPPHGWAPKLPLTVTLTAPRRWRGGPAPAGLAIAALVPRPAARPPA